MEAKNHKNQTNNALKEALTRRKGGELSSNFTFRMMQQVHEEVVRREKRSRLLFRIMFVSSVLFVLGLLVFMLFFYMDFSPKEYFHTLAMPKVSSAFIGFYWYVGGLTLVLLAFDYWLRHKRKKMSEE